MSATLTIDTGNGVDSVQVCALVSLPDAYGGQVSVAGHVQAPGKPRVPMSGGPFTLPAVPANGSTAWNLQVNLVTGALTLAVAAPPAPSGPSSSGPLMPLLVGQDMPAPTDPAVQSAGDPPPGLRGPGAPLLPGQLLVSPDRAPVLGRTPGPADLSSNVVIYRQTVTPVSPAVPWQNTTGQTPNLY